MTQPATIDLWVFPLEARGRLDALEAVLAPDEKARAGRFVYAADRESFIIGRALLRIILSHYLACPPDRLELTTGPQGKPSLAAPSRPIQFNLTHSGHLAALAVSTGCEVGVDIEKVRTIEPGFTARFFSAAENAAIHALPEDEQNLALFRCWSRKEAVLKSLGVGLLGDFKSFDVSVCEESRPSINGLDGPFALASFTPGQGYVGALAARTTSITLVPRNLQDVWSGT